MASISSIEGIGTSVSKKLQECGIKTTDGLLKKAATRSGRTALSKESGIDEKKILKFVNMADLFRVKGVGEEFSELLEAAGVDTVKEQKQETREPFGKDGRNK